MSTYAGRSHDEQIAIRKHEKQRVQEPPGGPMAREETEPDASHSSGDLTEQGRRVWRQGTGMDGGGRT